MSVEDPRENSITQEAIAQMRAAIGVRHPVPSWSLEVTSDAIEHFALGVGDDNPLWWDEDYAAASVWRGRIAPPCYLYSHFNGPRLKPEQGYSSVETYLPGAMGLLAAEKWRWERAARVGDIIRAESALTEVTTQQGEFGGLSVAQTETVTLLDSEDLPIARIEQKIRRFDRGSARSRRTYLDRPAPNYSQADRDRFAAQYDEEAARRRGGEPRLLGEVSVGDRLGPLLKGPLTFTNTVGFLLGVGSPNTPANRMAAAFLDLHPGQRLRHPVSGIVDTLKAGHFETAIAQHSGLPAGYDLGIARISWLSHLLTDWMGDAGFLVDLDAQVRRPNFIGDVTWLYGAVEAIDPAMQTVTIRVWATNQLDEETTRGTATVRLPSGA
jgi:acyl dehydratase